MKTINTANVAEEKNNSSNQDALKVAFEVLKNYKNAPQKGNVKYQNLFDYLKKVSQK